MRNEYFLYSLENRFGIHVHEDCVELETWTNGGVNMIVTLLKNEENGSLYEQFREYVGDFSMDDEIDIHREDSKYKSAFTIRQSLIDFTIYKEWLDEILGDLERINVRIQSYVNESGEEHV